MTGYFKNDDTGTLNYDKIDKVIHRINSFSSLNKKTPTLG